MMKNLYTLLIALFFSGIVSGQFCDKELYDVYSTDSLNAWIVGAEGTIFHTEDGGISWMDFSIDTTLNLLSIDFSDENNGFIVGDSGLVIRTIDGGSIWSIKDIGAVGTLSKVQFVDNDHGWILADPKYLISEGGIYRTIDGGDSWNLNNSQALIDFSMIDSLSGWGVGYSTNHKRVIKTIDGGLNWFLISDLILGGFGGATISFADSVNGLIFHGELGYPFLNKTIDGGNSWTLLEQVGYDICFSTVNNVWLTGNGIYYSNDFCQSFDHCDIGFGPTAVSAYGPDNGWAIGSSSAPAGYVWKLTGINDWVEVLPVNIEERKSDDLAIIVYPNPSSSTVTIELPTQPSKNTTLTISSTNGQQLITQPITKTQTEIDIRHLSTGIYIVKVWNDKDVMVQKVIKQ